MSAKTPPSRQDSTSAGGQSKPAENTARRPWQLNRGVLQCNRFMLENQVACDVCFEVGPPDGATERIYAHKYILISRSPLFEAMFAENLGREQEAVRVPDVEAIAFNQLLRYLYYEEVELDSETVIPVWYAAQKYMMLPLDKMCIEFLKKNITEENVCTILEQAMLYDNEEIVQRCLAVVGAHAETVFQSPSFFDLSHTALERIVGFEELKVPELTVFDVCLQWAIERCSRRGGLEPTPANIRHFMGQVLYKIRFPVMDSKEFSSRVVPAGILTDKESTQIFQWILTENQEAPPSNFRTDRRKDLLACERFESISSSEKMDCKPGSSESLLMKVGQDILFAGVGLFGSSGQVAIYEVTLTLRRTNGDLLAKTGTMRVETDGETTPLPVFLPTPVRIAKDEWHKVEVSLLGPQTYKGEDVKKSVRIDGVTFDFKEPEKEKTATKDRRMTQSTSSDTPTSEMTCQIPHVLFYKL